MKSLKFTTVAAATAMSLMACSDSSSSAASTNESAENYTQETVTTYTCVDGSVVSEATLCPTVVDPVTGEEVSGVADSSVVTTITCADGSVVEDAALCPQVVPMSSSAAETPSSSESISGPVVTPPTDDDDDTDLEDAKTLDGTEILVKLSGTSATVENNNGCVEVQEKVATITCPGDYYVTGTSTDFQIVVNTPGTENEGNTGVYLYNATLKSSSAPILVKNADKTVLHLVKGTVNVVEDGSDASAHLFTKVSGSQDTAKAAIYAKDDLNIKGSGKLTVSGNFKSGIHCSNDLKVKNGNITVNAVENGLKGKGSLQISGGVLNVTAKNGDGLKSDECVEATDGSCSGVVEGKGIVLISGGDITVKAGDDGIQAYNYVMVSDSVETATVKVTSTGKGIVSDNRIYMNGGDVTVDATDDGIHSNLNVYMNGGNVTVSSKDDGIHADSTLYLNGSTVNVKTAYEGMEAFYIRAQAGITATYGTDDGWNAAGGSAAGSSNGGNTGWGGMGGGMMSSSKGYIVISGGFHYISASGNDIDVLDANGTATQSGGVLILEIPSNSQGGGMMMAPGANQGGMGGNTGSGCSTNQAGGLIDTDNGYTITGGVMIGFGSKTEEYPSCSATSYNNSSYYGAANAAFKPQGSGSMIIYGGDVKSVAQVETAGMTEVKFPNGLSYMYK